MRVGSSEVAINRDQIKAVPASNESFGDMPSSGAGSMMEIQNKFCSYSWKDLKDLMDDTGERIKIDLTFWLRKCGRTYHFTKVGKALTI